MLKNYNQHPKMVENGTCHITESKIPTAVVNSAEDLSNKI